MRLLFKIVLIILGLFSFILGYGYWFTKTHAYLEISIYDASNENSFDLLKGSKIILRDKDATMLATGKSDPQHGSVYLSHPEVGSCHEVEHDAAYSTDSRNAWQRCFNTHSTWLVEWIRSVQFIDVRINDCQLENIPVTVEEFLEDWWMWWLPLPHVGGMTYTYLRIRLNIDPISCEVINSLGSGLR